MEKLNLTQEWDKVFLKSDKVDHKKVTFHNRYGITLAADMYTPKNTEGKLPAIAVSGPFGAVKEQSAGLYAQKMAELGLDDCLRAFLHRRERRYAPLCRFAGHQYRGFLRSGRLPLRAGER